MELVATDEFFRISVLNHSIQILKSSPKTFFLLTLFFIFPLSIAMLAESYMMQYVRARVNESSSVTSIYNYYNDLFFYSFISIVPLFTFSLLSTSATAFIVASLYTFKAVTFSSAVSAIPRVFPRVFLTFLWISLFMFMYNAIFYFITPIPIGALFKYQVVLAIFLFVLCFVVLISLQLYVTSLWQHASVVSVVESVYGLAAIKKSWKLLKGKRWDAVIFMSWYIILCETIIFSFDKFVLHGAVSGVDLWARVLVGGVLLVLLVLLTMVALVVQSIFYYVCKSFHHENIDIAGMQDLLGSYVKPQVKLNSMI